MSSIEGMPEAELEKLEQEFFEWLVSENTQYATSINVHDYNDRLDDYSMARFDRCKAAVDKFLEELKKIPRAPLSDKYKVDYDVFENYLMTYHNGYKWKNYSSLNPMNFLEGPHIDPDYLVNITPTDTKGDFEDFINRLEKFPGQIMQMKTRFIKAVKLGRTYHHVSITKVPDQIKRDIPDTPEDHSFYAPFNEALDEVEDISDSVKEELRSRAKVAIQTYMDSLEDLSYYLKNEYSKNLREGVGVSDWDKGEEFYKAVLQWHISLDLTPDEVHQKGLEEVDRISKKMKALMVKLGFTGTIKQAFNVMRKDPKFFLKSGDEMLERYNKIIKDIDEKLPLVFKNLPDFPIEVQVMPNDGCRGQYIAAAPDGSRPGVFQVNIHHPNESLKIEFMALALHEASPGHHLQYSVQQLAKLPEFRKNGMDEKYFQPPVLFPFYTAYIEGWALYAESLGEEMGMYECEYDLLGRYASEIFRACRLVVDTGVHFKNWTRREAINYLKTYTALGDIKIATEVDRYITWPGQACSYKIGELKIRELRAKAKNELGDSFDLKDYHSVILENGPVPLSTLERIVDAWIERVKSKKGISGQPARNNN